MSDQPRPVWLSQDQRDAVQAALESAAMPMGDAIEKPIEALLAAWDAAPTDAAGPHGAIRVAITNAYYDARNAGATMETAADNARDGVLRALGVPS